MWRILYTTHFSFFLSVSITLVHPSLYLYACIYVIYFIYVPAAVADPLLKMPINKAHLSFAPTFICKLFAPPPQVIPAVAQLHLTAFRIDSMRAHCTKCEG